MNLILKSIATLLAVVTSQSALSNGKPEEIVFGLADNGESYVAEYAYEIGYEGEESQVYSTRQAKLEDFTDSLLKLLQQSHETICESPLSPNKVSLTIEIVEVEWTKRQFCRSLSRIRPQIENGSEKFTQDVSFRVDSSFLNLNKIRDLRKRKAKGKQLTQFGSEIVEFFCSFPLRPVDVQLKVVPMKIEWSMESACRLL